ncbi:DUF4381 domain-containing protein [Legionella dresdenensis]|uniref:DUF4381 domain-containing protein n=1 Tax=Legionella dresdenensis TaxID=450200 RepID=A0ABV8CHU6_9GAMM
MPDAAPLAQLRDIHIPQPVGWWPLAPGWYVLIILLVLGLTAIIIWACRKHRQGRARREALKMLADYYQQYLQQQQKPAAISARISELLRRVALAHFPRSNVAGLQGEAWIEFLNQTGKNINFNAVRDNLLLLPYQNAVDTVNLKPLFTRAEAWIKQRRKSHV